MAVLDHKTAACARSLDDTQAKAQLDEWTRDAFRMMTQNLAVAERVVAKLGADNVQGRLGDLFPGIFPPAPVEPGHLDEGPLALLKTVMVELAAAQVRWVELWNQAGGELTVELLVEWFRTPC